MRKRAIVSMEYSNIQIDFVERTLQNLTYIEQQSIDKQKDFNEVTNLINSMMGLVCYPKEASKKDFDKLNTPLGDVQCHHQYGQIYLCLDGNGNPTDAFEDIIRHIRNSICHGNFIQGKSDEKGEIEELRLQDFNEKGKKKFDMVMTIEQLRKFVLEISQNYLSYVPHNQIQHV